jgi:hypothetical protein
MSGDIDFWVFVVICFIAIFMFFDLQRSKEGYDGFYRMDSTDTANPSPNNVYVSLTSLKQAEDNFSPDVGPYLL